MNSRRTENSAVGAQSLWCAVLNQALKKDGAVRFAYCALRRYTRGMTSVMQIEPADARDTGRCACCGQVSRCIWGYARSDGNAHGIYYVHWTVGHVADHGAHIDLVLGRWGDGTTRADRYAVSLSIGCSTAGRRSWSSMPARGLSARTRWSHAAQSVGRDGNATRCRRVRCL